MHQAKFNKNLLMFIATSVILTITLFTGQVDADAICTTPRCKEASADILRGIDNKTNPCDDFYQFTCGRWLDQANDLDSYEPGLSQWTGEKYQRQRELIERNDVSMLKQVKNMYTSCMNLTDIELRGNQPLMNLIEDLGGWPVLMNLTARQNYNTTWLELITRFKEQGFSHDMLLDITIRTLGNDSKYIVSLAAPPSLNDPDFYANKTASAAYHKMMVDSAVILGAAREEAESQMLEVLTFEKSLSSNNIWQSDRTIREADLGLVRKFFSGWDFESHLRTILGDIPYDAYADNSTKIGITHDGLMYLTSLDDKLSRTDPRVLANYMIWHIVRNSIIALPSRWAELRLSLRKVLGREEIPRWERCLDAILQPTSVFSPEGSLHIGLASSYARNHFGEQTYGAFADIAGTVKGEFIRFLDKMTWMDDEMSHKVKSKARTVSYSANYYDQLHNESLIEDFYKDLKIRPDDFFANMRRLRLWSTKHTFNQLRKTDERAKWSILGQSMDQIASYNPDKNYFALSLRYLDRPLFDIDQPNYLNYAGVGFVVGHEIAHAFDKIGRESYTDGTFRVWNTTTCSNPISMQSWCIIKQYDKYFYDQGQVQVNGYRTSVENIADNRAVRQAFRAYQSWKEVHGQEASLPGLNYTQDQMFWLQFARIWCTKQKPYQHDKHAPPRYRIIGSVSNSPEFAQSFSCPPGSPMNPTKKCALW